MVTALVCDMLGTRSLGTTMGVMSVGWTIGAAAGPAIGGFTFDMSGSYFGAFATGASAMLVATLLTVLVKGGSLTLRNQHYEAPA